MTTERKMLLLTLLGFAIPFGNVIGPYFINCKTSGELRFRKTLTIIGTILVVVSIAIPVIGMVCAFEPSGVEGIDPVSITKSIRWGFILPVGILVTIAALWRRTRWAK